MYSKIYAQGRDRSRYQPISDTSHGHFDTTSMQDTTAREPLDSTARIQNFKYVRKDEPYPQFDKPAIPFFLANASDVKYNVEFDSSNNVIIREQLDNNDIKYPLKISFEKYIKLRSRIALEDQFYKIVSEKYKIEIQDELQKLFSNISDITIPLPFASETIFGPPTINLKINGDIDITASYQKTSTDQQTILTPDQSQNNINFKQEVQVTAKGTIGDKLTIDADWNSQRTFDYENQLRLKYTGYPDEVVQKVEAGNVSLETKSNLIGSTEALFGIKGQFQLGPLTLTAIASQKKSEKKEVDITGGSQQTNFEIPVYQYSDNHFFLDTSYRPCFAEFYKYGTLQTQQYIAKQVAPDIEVWVQTTSNNPNKRFAVCWDSLPSKAPGGQYPWNPDSMYISHNPPQIDGVKASGYFIKLNPGEFTLNDKAGYISVNVNMPISPNDAVAVAYRWLQPVQNQIVQYGTYSNEVSKDSLVLVLVHFPGLQSPIDNPAHSRNWLKKIKNIYPVGVKNIRNDPTKFTCSVYLKPSSGSIISSYNGPTYLTIDSLDLRHNGGRYYPGDGPDNAFDFFPGYTIDLVNGEIIFPTLSPFYQTLLNAGVSADTIGVDTLLYTASKTTIQNYGTNKFFIGGTAIGDASSHYSLGFNVVEGSVKVFSGSVQLVEGSDYTVDYTTGDLNIRNQAALTAGANLKIQYESNDLFSLASKTLLGARIEYNINKNSYLGFTLLNLQQQTLNDKVRIGEEPTNNTILGIDGSTQIKTNFLTKLINKIPGYNTKEESTLDLHGEFAYMIPDPNTKKSLIPSDNGDAVAYIDDFEGAKKVISLGLNPLSWSLASIPIDSTYGQQYYNGDYTDTTLNLNRCKMEWYNTVNSVNVNDVYPNRSIGSSQSKTLTPMVLSILPTHPGMYTFIDSSHFNSYYGPPKRKWTGIMKYLNTTSTNFVDENIGFIEIWMKLDSISPADSDKMFIDLGIISEKVIANSQVPPPQNKDYHTEDINGTGVLDPQYDIGLDQMNYDQETAVSNYFGWFQGQHHVNTSDDQFAWTNGSTDFSQFNGLKGNSALSEGRKPDSEDLNGNGSLDVLNNYYEYRVPLDTTEAKNKYITGGNPSKGWYQFLIPLNQYYKSFGDASLTNVQYIRVWFKGFKNDLGQIEIVDFNLLGNQWQKASRDDTSYSISVVNIEDNPDIYNSPVPGNVLRQSDQTSVDPNVLLNEQSMSLEVRNLLQGQGKFAAKFFNTKPIDLLNYKIIKLFVNGDPNFKYYDTSNYDAAVVVRLGSDSLNYYEYRSPIHPDIRPNTPWNGLNEVKITFTDLTQIKQLRNSANIKEYFPVTNGPPGSKYAIIGNPTLSSLTLIALGVENNHNGIIAKPLTGSVWYDELRVLKTDDRAGYAYNVSAALKVADFGVFNFTYATVSPTFHALEDRFGSRDQTNNWEFSGTINLHKAINSILASIFSVKFKDFINLPITFDHSEYYDNPEYLPGTDVDLQTAIQSKYNQIMAEPWGTPALAKYYSDQVRIAAQDLRVSNRIAINGMKFTLPGENFFVKEMLNKIQIDYYWNGAKERSPTDISKYTWDMGGSIGMASNLKLVDIVHLDVGKLVNLGDDYKNGKVYLFFPFMPIMPFFSSTLNVGANFTRSRNDEILRAQGITNPTARAFNAARNFTLDWKFIENWIIDFTGNYSFAAGSDLTYLETTNDTLKRQRSNSQIYHDIFFHNGLINFGKDLSYTQVINMNPKFNIPGLKKFLDLTSSYRVQYGWTPSQTLVPGSSVGYTGDFQSTGYLKLNQIFELLKPSGGTENKTGSGGMRFDQNDQKESIEDILKLLKGFLPDQLTISYSQTKALTNSGVEGRPGFANFWVLFHTQPDFGPSRLYQLGWSNYPGQRAPLVALQDHEGYNNNLNINTFITPIFPNNLKISFTYKTTWSKDNLFNYNTDSSGNLGTPTSISNTRIIDRPSFIVTSNNQTIISKLGVAFNDPDPSVNAKNLSNAFDKIASFPFPSWDISLTGVEKFDLFSHFASAISLENSYSCDYKKTYSFNGIQTEFLQDQGITSGFSPLIGINVTFKDFQGGTLTASYKLNKTTNYDLSPSSGIINNTSTSDVSINASYTKSGFKLPLFGLSLDNDLSIVFTYTRTTNDPRTITYHNDNGGYWTDDALNGSISTTLNPSIQYALSKSVSLQVFYKYTIIGPTPGSVQIPTRKSNEAGLNLKLSIQ